MTSRLEAAVNAAALSGSFACSVCEDEGPHDLLSEDVLFRCRVCGAILDESSIRASIESQLNDQAPPTRPGVDPTLVDLSADDLDELAAHLEGARSIATGLATLLRQQAEAARREGLQ